MIIAIGIWIRTAAGSVTGSIVGALSILWDDNDQLLWDDGDEMDWDG